MPIVRPRRVATAVLSTTLAMSAFAAGGPGAAGADTVEAERVLSHFLCYDGKLRKFEKAPTVGLQNRFFSHDVTVREPVAFCAAVRKKHGGSVTPVVSHRQHLKIFSVDAPPGAIIPLLVTNQFVTDALVPVDTQLASMAVPTRKRPHRFPAGLDHFACYAVDEALAFEDRVKLRDQFRRYRKVAVGPPVAVCLASTKTHDGRTFEARHPDSHLVCHLISPRRVNVGRRWTANQFERSYVRVRRAVVLCVPSVVRPVD